MNPIQPQRQTLNKSTLYPSLMNTPPQLDTTLDIPSNVNVVQDIPVALDHTTPTPHITSLSMNENHENQPLQILCPNLNNIQDYPSSSLAHPQENAITSEYSFFYLPRNDFQMYHIICEEIPLSFELVS